MLWIILTLMTALAAVGLAIPLVRRQDAARTPRNDTVQVLKAQIGEIDAQAAVGALPNGEAEALKADVKRRVLPRVGRPRRQFVRSASAPCWVSRWVWSPWSCWPRPVSTSRSAARKWRA